MSETGALWAGLYDDAAVFPPGSMRLPDAVLAHLAHRRGHHAGLVGPLVVGADHLDALDGVVAGLPEPPRDGDLTLAVTATADRLPQALDRAVAIAGTRLVSVEVGPSPDGQGPAVVSSLGRRLSGHPDVTVYVEAPRPDPGPVLAALADCGLFAKHRTGGVRAEQHPQEPELAAALVATAAAGVPFKATAGLHHAVRNSDPWTGFEQHGFLNVLLATAAAAAGAEAGDLVPLLADRDPERVAERAGALEPRVRERFHSLGTCSISEPVAHLVALGLLDDRALVDLR